MLQAARYQIFEAYLSSPEAF